MILSWIRDLLKRSDWDPWVDHVIIIGDEHLPFMILCHRKRSFTKLLGSFEGLISFALQNTRVCCIGFVDFTNDDRFQLTTRRLKVEICLEISVDESTYYKALYILCAGSSLPRFVAVFADQHQA